MKKPKGYEDSLGEYRVCLVDGYCGEPIAWGYKIIRHLGQERFSALRRTYHLECAYPNWYVITKALGHKQAKKKYGKITAQERGPRGGWKSVTFGEKTFIDRYVAPERQSFIDHINKPKKTVKKELDEVLA